MRKDVLVKELINKIKEVKIQGAEAISVESIKTLKEIIKFSEARTATQLLNEVEEFNNKVSRTRPTEPCLRNSLNFIIKSGALAMTTNDSIKVIKSLIESCDFVIKHFEDSKKKINELVYKKVPNNSVIFTHCHSSTVVDALIYAHKRGKNFIVHNTETRPLFQGRITAKQLSKAGIEVVHYVDSAARLALKKADVMFIGADAITSEGKVINKIGSEMFAEVAHNYDVPIYSCTDSWKFDVGSVFAFESKIEQRFAREVWADKPKNVKISNFAFEKVNPENITGIISELGIFRPTIFLEEFRRKYPQFFK